MRFKEHSIDISFNLVTNNSMISMIKDWFHSHRMYIGDNYIGMENKSFYIDYHEAEYNRVFYLTEIWKEINLSTDSYLYILNRDNKTLTLIENNELKVISIYRPKAIEIICNHFYSEYGEEEDLINNMMLLYKYEEEKRDEIISEIKEKLTEKVFIQERISENEEKADKLNKDFLAQYGSMLD